MRVFKCVAAAIAALFIGAASAAACEFNYVVQPGDTLAEIAEAAYGGRSYQLIYSRNAAQIDDPSAPPVGATLVIPCIAGVPGMEPDEAALTARMTDGGATATAAAADATTAADAAADAPRRSNIVVLAPNDGTRYASASLPEGGMTPAIAAKALASMGWRPEAVEFAFLDNRDQHLSTLLPGEAFAIGLPWRMPACGQPSFLTDRDFALCEFYEFSEPLFAKVSGVYGLKGALPGEEFGFTGLRGARFCIANDADGRDLAERGLGADQVSLTIAPTTRACFEALLAGEVDYVSGESFEAEIAIVELGAPDRVEEAPWLAMPSTLHAIAPRDDAAALAVLADIDAGVLKLRESGEWFATVARYLTLR